jgi:hypothetical protein
MSSKSKSTSRAAKAAAAEVTTNGTGLPLVTASPALALDVLQQQKALAELQHFDHTARVAAIKAAAQLRAEEQETAATEYTGKVKQKKAELTAQRDELRAKFEKQASADVRAAFSKDPAVLNLVKAIELLYPGRQVVLEALVWAPRGIDVDAIIKGVYADGTPCNTIAGNMAFPMEFPLLPTNPPTPGELPETTNTGAGGLAYVVKESIKYSVSLSEVHNEALEAIRALNAQIATCDAELTRIEETRKAVQLALKKIEHQTTLESLTNTERGNAALGLMDELLAKVHSQFTAAPEALRLLGGGAEAPSAPVTGVVP